MSLLDANTLRGASVQMTSIFGIVGDLDGEALRAALDKMTEEAQKLNSSVQCVFLQDGVGLFHCIATGGEQSVSGLLNETSTIIGLCAGEIYNCPELAEELRSRGHKVEREAGHEVLVHLYEDTGVDFPKYCNGAFTVVIWDCRNRRLLMARDHLGCRTLFYAVVGGCLVFASSVKVLLASKSIAAELDPIALDYYFANTCVPHPRTAFKNIYRLWPGYTLTFQDTKVTHHCFWPLEKNEECGEGEFEALAFQIRSLVEDAVRIRARGPGRIGSVLSGGVDSSAIAAILCQNHHSPLDVFGIGFHETDYDDSPLQKIMVDRYPLKYHTSMIQAADVPDLLEKVVRYMDVPINNASAMGTYRCFELAREWVDVVFEGEGADELFCGGGGVVGEALMARLHRIPQRFWKFFLGWAGKHFYLDDESRFAKVRRFVRRVTMPEDERLLTWLPAFDRPARKKLLRSPYKKLVGNHDEYEQGRWYLSRCAMRDSINRYQYAACKTYLCDDLLFKNERMAMANRVINRTPFVDYRLAELAFRIPGRFKITGVLERNIEKKVIYRTSLQGVVPNEILNRKKTRGFSQPTGLWLKKELRDYSWDILLGPTTLQRGIWEGKYVRKLLEQHNQNKVNHDRLLWGLITLEMWMRHFVDWN